MKLINLKKGQKFIQADGTEFIAPYAGVYFDDKAIHVRENAVGIYASYNDGPPVAGSIAYSVSYDPMYQPIGSNTYRPPTEVVELEDRLVEGLRRVRNEAGIISPASRLGEYQAEINRISEQIYRNQMLFGTANVVINEETVNRGEREDDDLPF
jgi:hypothetical protein